MNIETQEPTWDVPPGGYTRKDGMLVLATGKVIEDPLTTMTDEERRAKELETKCSECESRDATRFCEQCGDRFCTTCYNDNHKTGARVKHSWSRLGPIECGECEKEMAARWCVVCDDPFCGTCWESMHRRGRRAAHPYCPIFEGKLDPSALGPDGLPTGDEYTVGPQERGGGEDGEGNGGAAPAADKDLAADVGAAAGAAAADAEFEKDATAGGGFVKYQDDGGQSGHAAYTPPNLSSTHHHVYHHPWHRKRLLVQRSHRRVNV